MKLRTKFQDENFKLGEVVEGVIVECLGKHEEKLRVIATAAKGSQHTFYYSSIKKFMNDWEDAPEKPKEWWYIDIHGPHKVTNNDEYYQQVRAASKEIGNYFETKEEAEKAVEKLKAWKRLKDKGFRFKGYTNNSGDLFSCQVVRCDFNDFGKESSEDLELLFRGEE